MSKQIESYAPGAHVWLASDYKGKVTVESTEVMAAVFVHPLNKDVPVGQWPNEHKWEPGWHYKLYDAEHWVRGDRVFASRQKALKALM